MESAKKRCANFRGWLHVEPIKSPAKLEKQKGVKKSRLIKHNSNVSFLSTDLKTSALKTAGMNSKLASSCWATKTGAHHLKECLASGRPY